MPCAFAPYVRYLLLEAFNFAAARTRPFNAVAFTLSPS